MKKAFPLLTFSSLLISCNSPVTTSTQDISGVWHGDYNCGKAQLKLDIKSVVNGQVSAVFNFGYYSDTTTKTVNPNEQGSFNLSGTFQNNLLDLKGGDWIAYPKQGSWVPLDVRVTYDAVKNQFVGTLPNTHGGSDGDACLKVTLTR